jgi:uncharacterized protein YjbI with pentapeptide repeats
MARARIKRILGCLLLCSFAVVSTSLPWVVLAVATEEGIIPPNWLFHKCLKGISEPGGLYAEYFDCNGNFVKEITLEGPIYHGYKTDSFKTHHTAMFGGFLLPYYQNTVGKLWGNRFTPMDTFEEWLSGWIKLPKSGCYEFRLDVDDFAEMDLDGKPIIKWDNKWAAGSGKAVFYLEAEKPYKIRIRFKNRLGSASLALSYKRLNTIQCDKLRTQGVISKQEILDILRKGKAVEIFGGEINGDLDLREINDGNIRSRIVIRGATVHGSLLAGFRRDEWGKRRPVCFQETIDFTGTRFMGQVTFEGTQFEQNAYFDHVVFEEYASLTRAEFNGETSFTSVRFKKGGEFVGTKFNHPVDFRRISWSQHAPFTGAEFKQVANFSGSSFEKTALFDGAVFGGKAIFTSVKFGGGAAFNGSETKGLWDFTGSRLENLIDELKSSGFQDIVVIETLRNLETNYRKFHRLWEANRIAADRYSLEISRSPWWFHWPVKFLVGFPSKYGTEPIRLFAIACLTFLLPTILLWRYRWHLKQGGVSDGDPRWARDSALRGILKVWKWILSLNALLFLSYLFSTEAAPIYMLLSPLK